MKKYILILAVVLMGMLSCDVSPINGNYCDREFTRLGNEAMRIGKDVSNGVGDINANQRRINEINAEMEILAKKCK